MRDITTSAGQLTAQKYETSTEHGLDAKLDDQGVN
jgi:hypothetical protein